MNDIDKKPMLKLLVIITDWEKAAKICELLRKSHVYLNYQCRAMGTASSEILDVLGLSSTDKMMNFCVSPKESINQLLEDVSHTMKLQTKGKGIAFTIPLSGIGAPILKLVNEHVREKIISELTHIEREVEKMKSEVTHNLIVAVINQGYSEEFMEVAKNAGATGGTAIHARRVGLEEPTKFLGISVQAEKEVISILTKKETKVEIMKAISHSFGLNTEAQGIIFALPVDSVAGLNE